MRHLLLILCVVASAAFAGDKSDKDITPLLTSSTWKWDHPTAKNNTLTFKKDGTCKSNHWTAVWSLKDRRTVELVFKSAKRATLVFDDEVTSFKGTHADGLELTGKRVGEVPASLR